MSAPSSGATPEAGGLLTVGAEHGHGPDDGGGEAGTGDPACLAQRLNWVVRDEQILRQALAHRSWSAEHVGEEPNERLEFLGDAVLGLIVTDYLYQTHPGLPEGELAKARAAVVNSVSLADKARELDLGSVLLLGKGESSSGGRHKPSILADALEAVIGAMYLDAGYDPTSRVVLELFGARLDVAARGPGEDDYKTRLQELSAQLFDDLPAYHVTDTGPDHAKVFRAEVFLGGRLEGRGEGRSKKQAEQMAARHAYSALEGTVLPSRALPIATPEGTSEGGTGKPGDA